jgi:hypothetical protein
MLFTNADKKAIEAPSRDKLVNDDFRQPVTPKTCSVNTSGE